MIKETIGILLKARLLEILSMQICYMVYCLMAIYVNIFGCKCNKIELWTFWCKSGNYRKTNNITSSLYKAVYYICTIFNKWSINGTLMKTKLLRNRWYTT